MPKLSELSKDAIPIGIPKVDWADFRLLWYEDFWDGPETGILLYQGKKCRFEMFSESDDELLEGYGRRFFIIDLSPEQILEIDTWHKLFQEKVGGHTDYIDGQRRDRSLVKPQATWNEYTDAAKNRLPLNFSENEVIGWFED